MYSDRRHQQRELIDQTMASNENENLPEKLNHLNYGIQISETNSNGDVGESQIEEYCFVRMNYRNSISVKQIDELKIVQYNEIIYRGCLQDGDSFIFKSRRDANKSAYKLYIYRNDLLDNEMISCCEYGLMHYNQYKSFQIEQIIKSKPCQKCQSKDDTFPSLSEVSEKKANRQSTKRQKSVSFSSKSPEIRKYDNDSSENNQEFFPFKPFENETIFYNSINGDSSSKKTDQPPQISPMSSYNEHSFPSTPISSDTTSYNFFGLSNQDRNTQSNNHQQFENETNESVSLPNNIFETLANQLYNLMFQAGGNTETSSSDTIHREKGNVEWFNLIYLHTLPPDPSIVQKIRRLINIVMIFNDTDDCIACINSLSNQRIVLILSDNFCDSLLPQIKNILNILSIYILSANPDKSLTFSSTQIRGVYQSIDDIYEMISDDVNPIKSDLLLIRPVYASGSTLDTAFIFFHLLCDILLDRNETEHAFQELVHFARQEYEGNEYELAQIEEFEKSYKKTRAISWFSRKCFLLKMLHRAILLREVDILFKLRVFIRDLKTVLEKRPIIEPISVYIGNIIEQSEINPIAASKTNENLLTFHQFLFASTDQSQAIARAKKLPRSSEEFLNLLIRIDFPSAAKCLTRLSSSNEDNDGINIFINAGIATKIIAIEKDYQEKGYILIHLQYVSYANEINIKTEMQVARNGIDNSSPLFRLGRLLLKINRQSFSEQFFSNLVNEDFLINDTERQKCLSQSLESLGLIHYRKENFKRASELLLLCLKAYHRILPVYSSYLYETYRDLGESFYRMDEYQLGIDYYQQALDTQIRSDNPKSLYAAYCYYKLGVIYFKLENDENAIQALERAEKILKQSDETYRPELISVYETLGDNYNLKDRHDDAIIYYNKVIEVLQSIEPNDSKKLCAVYFVIGNLYSRKEIYRDAMIYYTHSYDYAREFLPEKHYTFVILHNNIGRAYYQVKQYLPALDHYSQGLFLASESLPGDSTFISTLLSNIALVLSDIERFDEAIESMEKSIEQLRKTLSDNDEEVIQKQTLLDAIKQKKILYEIVGEPSEYF
ncbi:unnamed protein product [Adineta steineri]|uniref:DUF4590 domain-containing protein n=1 Tax=Adineta steineri TaxID=433720 RepID=A0A815IQN7_9BILA|nr:unnamed protein product [Adineta steineri]CAF1604278.1 unnamed protein product [Adineta steineri]